jgi:septin family protein
MEENNNILRIMAVGGAGTGKSALGNTFISGRYDSNEFTSRDAPDLGGVTRIVSSKTGNLFNDSN